MNIDIRSLLQGLPSFGNSPVSPLSPGGQTASSGSQVSPELQEILTQLKLQTGQVVEGKVLRISALSPTERQQLTLIHAQSVPQNPLLTQIQDPNIKLVEIGIQKHTVSTLSALPLKTDQAIRVLITTRGLQLVETTASSTSASGQVNPAASSPANRTQAPQPTNPEWPPSRSDFSHKKTLSSLQQQALIDGITRTLPNAEPPKQLMSTIDQALRLLVQSNQSSDTNALGRLTSFLQQLQTSSLNPAALDPNKPHLLQQALNQSGTFYEKRSLNHIQPTQTAAHLPLSKTSEVTDTDLKANLIQLSQFANALMSPTFTHLNTAVNHSLNQLMMNLAFLFNPRSTPPRSKQDIESVLGDSIKQFAEKALSRIQLNQYRTINSHFPETPGPLQWHLDIPLRSPDGYGNLYLQFLYESKEEMDPDKNKRTKKEMKKSARWKVFLELELDDLGTLAAEISAEEKSMEATLWSQNDTLRQKAMNHLSTLKMDLEKQGIEVKDLRFSANPPPNQKIQLDYSLISVRT